MREREKQNEKKRNKIFYDNVKLKLLSFYCDFFKTKYKLFHGDKLANFNQRMKHSFESSQEDIQKIIPINICRRVFRGVG